LAFRDGCGLVRVVVLEGQRSAGEHVGLALIQRDRAHGISGGLRPVEAVQHFIRAVDDLPGYVALMGHAHVRHGVAAHKAVFANEAEHAGQHLVTAGAVMGVEQNVSGK